MPAGLLASVFKPYRRILNTPDDETSDKPQTNIATSSNDTKTPRKSLPAEPKTEVSRCTTCAKIGRVLDCCKSGPCALCADIDHVLHQQHLELEIWEEHCNTLNQQLVAWNQQYQYESQEKNNVIEEMKVARTHLAEQHRRQAQEQSARILELKNDRQLLQDELAKAQDPENVDELTKKCRSLEALLGKSRTESNIKMELLRESLKKEYAQEIEKHFKKYTCMPQDAWQPFLDKNKERSHSLNIQIQNLIEQVQQQDEYIKELKGQLQALRASTDERESKEDGRVKSLTSQLQALQEMKRLQEEEHDANFIKLKTELAIMQSDLIEEVHSNRETDSRLRKELKDVKASYESSIEALETHVRSQKEKYGQELREQSDASKQHVQSLQEKLDQKDEHIKTLEQRLLPIANEQDLQAQEDSDYIESLKQQCQEVDEEDKRLSKLLEERKAVLRRLHSQQQAQLPNQFVIKEAKNKKGKCKKK